VVPNGKIDDFYVQHFVSGESSFVSLIRRNEADRWLAQLRASGLKPLMLSLGPFPVYTILPQLNIYEGDFIIDGHEIERDPQANWINYRYETGAMSAFTVKLADEKTDEKLVIPYAAAFQLVMSGQMETVHAQTGLLDTDLQQTLSGIKLKVQAAIILVVFFVLLLANYGMFSWLSSANTKLSDQAVLYSENANSVNEMAEQVKEKEERVSAFGWESGVSKSALIDQVASLLPPEITLTDISVDPVDQATSRAQRSPMFFKRKLQITGTSQQIIPVNEWIARIKTKRWVKNVQMDSYTFDSELNTGKFLITISY
jgi:Tfp pilus assembly protein PilN